MAKHRYLTARSILDGTFGVHVVVMAYIQYTVAKQMQSSAADNPAEDELKKLLGENDTSHIQALLTTAYAHARLLFRHTTFVPVTDSIKVPNLAAQLIGIVHLKPTIPGDIYDNTSRTQSDKPTEPNESKRTYDVLVRCIKTNSKERDILLRDIKHTSSILALQSDDLGPGDHTNSYYLVNDDTFVF